MHSWIQPRRTVSHTLLGLLALALLIAFAAGCSRNPVQRRDAYFQRGKKYFQDKKYADAAIEFQNAVKIDPKFAQGYYYLGLTQKDRGELQSAFQAFSKEMEVDPKQTPGALELANLYLMANQPTQARQLAGDILTREPRNFSALLIVAQSYLGAKNYTEALKEFDKLKAMRPKDAPIYLSIGIAQLGNGDTSGAEANFQKAIELEPTSSEPYRDLANLYQKMGRPEPAAQNATTRAKGDRECAGFVFLSCRSLLPLGASGRCPDHHGYPQEDRETNGRFVLGDRRFLGGA